MKKLEDIPKKEIFTVPDGYFDTLPGIIQTRLHKEEKTRTRSVFIVTLQYALPVFILFILTIFWYSLSNDAQRAETILASVQTEDLIAYLNTSDLTVDEVLESVEFNSNDLDEIEGISYDLNLGE